MTIKLFGCSDAARQLNLKLKEIKSSIDEIETPSLAKIKRVLNYMHFGYIASQEQLELNQANVILLYKNNEATAYGCDVAYYIQNKKTALVYAGIKPKYQDGEVSGYKVLYQNEINYSYFIADLLDEKIIFSKEFDQFIKINKHEQTFELVDEAFFKVHYPASSKQAVIKNFLPTFEELYRKHIKKRHNFTIRRYSFYTNDFIYDVDNLIKEDRRPHKNELFFAYYEVSSNELNQALVTDFKQNVTSDPNTLHNLNLMHAYVMRRKLGLEPPEKFFAFKDGGRTGKGLFVKSFNTLFSVNKLNLDTLLSPNVFERNNEQFKAYGCDVVHINEAKAITENDMRAIRPLATNEWLTARLIGGDSFTFKPHCTLLLDTNEAMTIGTMKANVSRTVNISLNERPATETDEARHKFFKPYWDYIAPDGEAVHIASALSFLVDSLEYLQATGGKFQFKEVAFTDTTKNEAIDYIHAALLKMQKDAHDKEPFILANDPIVKNLLEKCYGNSKDEIERKKSDFERKGIELSKLKKIDGQPKRVHCISNTDAFHDYFN